MKVDVVLGLQWGDEGKGKVVDVLTPRYDIIARFQGGPNAGHTLIFNGEKYVLHTVPSGIFRDGVENIIGNGVVLDPVIFMEEVASLRSSGKKIDASNLKIAKKAHLILPTHRMLDAASEAAKGKDKIGSTLKGIGPTYMDKTGRNGVRVGDILAPDFADRYNRLKSKHQQMLNDFKFEYDCSEYEAKWLQAVEELKQFDIVEGENEVNSKLQSGKTVLAEGAQGSLLDIDYGTYPFVTSSNTVCAGVCTGLGVAPTKIANVYGIFKAYCTRVGSGPFPTELFDEVGEELCKIGMEFGATTGRRRRCGWLDMVALKYSVMVNGVTNLIMMKCDVMNSFKTIKIATGYKINGEVVREFPYECPDQVEIEYKEMKGWDCSLEGIREYDKFPKELKEYIEYIEEQTSVPVSIVSIGPDREETIIR